MDFKLSDEQRATRDAIKKFMTRECNRETARVLDNDKKYPDTLLKSLADMGMCGLMVDENYGGVGSEILTAVLVVEELSTLNPSLAGVYIDAAFSGGRTISLLGSELQKKLYLPAITDGSAIFTLGLTESDYIFEYEPVAQCEALLSDDYFVVKGNKNQVKQADKSDYILALVNTAPDEDYRNGLSFLAIDTRSQGISIKNTESVGFNSLTLCDVNFDNVFVPRENVLGGFSQLNQGYTQYNLIMKGENLGIAACCVGMAQGAYDYARNYARERIQFGKPIIKFEAVQNMLVDMAIAIKTARLMTYQAAWMADQGEECMLETTMARTVAEDTVRKVSLQGLQIFGGYGYAMEYDIQRYVRDSMVILGNGKNVETLKTLIGSLLD